MGKRKKAVKNIVRVDIGDDPPIHKTKSLPLLAQHLSKDGRQITQSVHEVPAPQVVYPAPSAFEPSPLLVGGLDIDSWDLRADLGEVGTERLDPLRVWSSERDMVLREVLRHEGRTEFLDGRCYGCAETGKYRCVNCIEDPLYCQTCIVGIHKIHPFHQIEEWNGHFFQKSSLRTAGLRVQLGHYTGSVCTSPQRSSRPFTVVHTNGIHLVDIHFCGCSLAGFHGNRVEQLLRRRLLPATTTDPQTASTFELLQLAQVLSVQSKLSLYDFYISIEILTDATGIDVKDRYQEFLRMLRMWRHIRLMKRGGRGHDPTGVGGTSPGELAVSCPACPHPNINLPKDWASAPKDSEYLYYQSLGIDACFRFKRRHISSYEKDPELGPGFAYIVSWEPYRCYLRKRTNENETSTCSGLSAIEHANTKFSKGYATTGIVCTTCSHEFVLPEGAGQLQKGERYSNVDYIVLKSVLHNPDPKKIVSYDIMCQWSTNLQSRLKQFPLSRSDYIIDKFVAKMVPKFHLAAHRQECRANFSLNFEPGAGRRDMEGPERTWFGLQGGGCTKDQGPGYWSDAMDDKFGHWNWSKLVRLGTLLAKKYIHAAEQTEFHRDELDLISSQLSPALVQSWKTMIRKWETDRSSPNPYYTPSTRISEGQIRQQLMREEEAEQSMLDGGSDHCTPTKFLLHGLDLEHAQRKLRATVSRHDPSNLPVAVIEQRTIFRRQLKKFRHLQRIHQPEVVTMHATSNATEIDVLDASLNLPSALPPDIRAQSPPKLVAMERALRLGQCQDTLTSLRLHLSSRSRLIKDKLINVRHQGPNTKSRTLLARVSDRISVYADKYRAAYSALNVLDPDPGAEWRREFLYLQPKDVRGISEPSLQDHLDPARAETVRARTLLSGGAYPEGNRTISWIWMGFPTDSKSGTPQYNEEFRIEWSKAHARSERWNEEVELLKEEMRRTLEFLKWKSSNWLAKASDTPITELHSPPDVEGVNAYAFRQAAVFRSLRDHFFSLWRGLKVIDVSADTLIPTPPSVEKMMEVDGGDC